MTFRSKYFVEKDKRILFKKIEFQRLWYISILRNRLVSSKIKIKVLKKLRLSRRASITALRSRCIISNSAKSVIKFFQLNRIFFRQFALAGKLIGVRKSSW
jgi:small subunit ribosomal protein S14